MSKQIVADLIEKFPVDCFFERLVNQLLDAFFRDQRIHAKDIIEQILLALVANISLILFGNLLQQVLILLFFEVKDDMVLFAEIQKEIRVFEVMDFSQFEYLIFFECLQALAVWNAFIERYVVAIDEIERDLLAASHGVDCIWHWC